MLTGACTSGITALPNFTADTAFDLLTSACISGVTALPNCVADTAFDLLTGACISGEDQIFLAGGAIRKINYRGPFSTEGVSPNLFMYDRHFGSWQVKSKMNYGRSQFALTMLDG